MKKFCLLLLIVGLCACHRPERAHVVLPPTPILDPTLPSRSSTPVAVVPTSIVTPPNREPEIKAPVEPPLDIARVVEELNGRLQDVYFGFDSSELAPDALAVLQGDADLLTTALVRRPNLKVTIEGHCDERGSAEYNLALGDRRARRAGDALHELRSRLPAALVVSYGKEAPQCTDATESCWQRNRRAHFVVKN